MPSTWRQLAADLLERMDHELLPRMFEAGSLDTRAIRAELRRSGLAWYEPDAGMDPYADQLEVAAEAVIRRATRGATLRGGLAGVAGAAAIVPEVAAAMLQSVHLAQRLAVVYGHDPHTDRGRLLVARALAAAHDVALPRQGGVGMRVRDLPVLFRGGLSERDQRAAWLVRALAVRIAWRVGGRLGRVVPGIGAGTGAIGSRRSARTQGERMATVFRSAWQGSLHDASMVVDAVEVIRPGPA